MGTYYLREVREVTIHGHLLFEGSWEVSLHGRLLLGYWLTSQSNMFLYTNA